MKENVPSQTLSPVATLGDRRQGAAAETPAETPAVSFVTAQPVEALSHPASLSAAGMFPRFPA